MPIAHVLDFVELAGYGSAEMGGHERDPLPQGPRRARSRGRDVVIVDEVIDTGLTMHYLHRALSFRNPESLACATLFDRPYRRLVDDLPIRYVGFTIPDEFFVGYGFALNERGRNLPDLHLVE